LSNINYKRSQILKCIWIDSEVGYITTIAAMPALNEDKYIAKTIIGCRKYGDKVIVVDGSTDATAEAMPEYMKNVLPGVCT